MSPLEVVVAATRARPRGRCGRPRRHCRLLPAGAALVAFTAGIAAALGFAITAQPPPRSSLGQRGRTRSPSPPAAPGFFPGRPELAPEAAPVGAVVAEPTSLPVSGEAATPDAAETRLLREHTGALAQEMQLLTETLRGGGTAAHLRRIVEARKAARRSGDPPAVEAPVAPAGAAASAAEAASEPEIRGATFNDVMFEMQNELPGHREKEITDYLRQTSTRFVARRTGGELPLGQVVPQPGAAS